MKNQSKAAHDALAQLADKSWEEHQVVLWIMANWKTLLWGLAFVLAAVILLFRLNSSRAQQAEFDFRNADTQFERFIQAPNNEAASTALASLEKFLNNHPELHAKYDGLIAQALIGRGQNEAALTFALPAIKRTDKQNNPFYTEYDKATLLIGEGKYAEALTISKDLQSSLLSQLPSQQQSFGQGLFAANLLRIGVLQQQLDLKEEEWNTWQTWKQYLQGKEAYVSATPFQQQLEIFKIGNVSLMDYIQERENQLKKLAKK